MSNASEPLKGKDADTRDPIYSHLSTLPQFINLQGELRVNQILIDLVRTSIQNFINVYLVLNWFST
jgi:hypothetical protein